MAPLNSDGSDFPCKGYEYDTIQGPTAEYVPGQTYNMTLAGSIMHGGGSCQIALSYDQGKTFKVIKSIIGGCPYKKSYSFTIPSYAPDGTAVLAWTWQNNIGNREFYMNCAEVQVSSAEAPTKRQAGASTSFADLPAIWVANLPTINNCETIPEVSPVYPFPGPDVEYGGGYTSASSPTAGDCEVPARFRAYGGGLIRASSAAPRSASAASPAPQSTLQAQAAVTASSSIPTRSGPPIMAAALAATSDAFTTQLLPLPSFTSPVDEDASIYQRLYEARVAATTSSATSSSPTNDPETITLYTTISACPSEAVSTIYRPSTRTWTTSYTRPASPSPSPTQSSDVLPFPPSSPSYISSASEANRLVYPCAPNTLLCSSRYAFLTCAPTPRDSEYYGSRTYIYGYERGVADGMACLPFLSPYTDGYMGQRQDSGEQGKYRDDRYVRDRRDGSCPANREGGIRCKDGGRGFFVCDQGGWVDMGATAEGTVCRDGEIVEG
ncbi:hypothetical protein CAC42_4166 [Sphaceloma murrayae]|uniref:Uncharacterized protein n=1 Tax=Sphaceloma murrayae TaxID=2082308 RepID=A0A2K1QKN5_9PEZI|nr:hypothetical protein CAC42_4166 [Sphaceloma murrayae]